MRVLRMILVSAAALLVPALAYADPAQTQGASAPAVQTAPASAPVVASQAPQSAATTKETVTVTAKAASDPDEVVCRMSPPATGSRLGGARECHAAREWDRRMQESQRIVTGNQMMGLAGPLNSPGGK